MASSSVSQNKKIAAVLLIIAILLTAAVFLHYNRRPGNGAVRASGTVEVREIQLAAQASGRIIELNVRESQRVRKGDLLARLSLDGAGHELAQSRAQAAAARQRYMELKSGFRREDIERAKANEAALKTQYEQAARDAKRFQELAAEGAVAARDAELYAEAADARRSALKAASDQLTLLRNGYRPEQVAAARAAMDAAEAALERSKILLGYKEFRSPADGVILTKNYELGDVVAAGAALAALGVADECWVKLYIPSTQLGLVRLNGKAEVRVDAYPGRAFEAFVSEVSQRAEYNPRLSLTQSERANMVFWIKVTINDPDGVIKPGMPADVVLL